MLDRDRMSRTFHGMSIPDYMQESLWNYVTKHYPIGGFLRAVLSNNLMEAVGKADDNNLPSLPAYTNWLYNDAPSDCHGSPEKVDAWLALREETP